MDLLNHKRKLSATTTVDIDIATADSITGEEYSKLELSGLNKTGIPCTLFQFLLV